MFNRSRTLSALALFFILTGVLSNCAVIPRSNRADVVTIAVVEKNPGSLESPNPQSAYAGVKLALDQFEAQTGVDLRVDLYNDEGNPAKAAQVASEIVSSNAVAVIGHSSIETADSAGQVYDQYGVPVITIAPLTEHLTLEHPSHFAITYTAEAEAAYLASYLMKLEDKFTVGIIHEEDEANQRLQREFRNLLAKHRGEVAFRETISISEAPESASGLREADLIQLEEVASRVAAIPQVAKPDILFIAASEEATAVLRDKLREKGVSISIRGAEILDEAVLQGLIGTKVATIIFTSDEYGQTLARQFENTFLGLGGQIHMKQEVDERLPRDQALEEIASRIIADGDVGTIFIATDDITAAQFIVLLRRKGLSAPIVGAGSMSSPEFIEAVSGESEEIATRGYFTNGILATRALIFDSANRYANQFLRDYQSAYKSIGQKEVLTPGDKVINGYDATLALIAAVQNAGIVNSDLPVEVKRQNIYNALLDMDDAESGTTGIVGPIFFDPSRKVPRAARFGIYQNGEIISANVQFEPISAASEIRDLPEQLQRERIITVNGNYVYKANIVYAGVDLIEISEIDMKTSTYKMDFYLWFRYRPNEKDEDFKPDDFVFTNAEGDVTLTPVREETNPDGTILKTYRVSGVFKHQFQFQDYPFDRQDLLVEFRNQNASTTFIQYVVDRVGMRYESEAELLDNFRKNGAFDSIFGWDAIGASATQDVYPTYSTFGSPQNFGRAEATNYSLIQINVSLQRDSLQYIIKSLLPLLITLVLAYIMFYLPLGHSERLAVGSTALLTTAFFHLTLADALPEIGYTVAMEYLFYASYLMSALIVLLETISIRLERKVEMAHKKAERDKYEMQREKLNLIGKIVYPIVLLGVLGVGFLVYSGVITLGPREGEGGRLRDLILASSESARASFGIQQPQKTTEAVTLTLSSWRPEDTEEIRKLLDEFEAYAAQRGSTIHVDYKPVMSVNYDSILGLQLSRGMGPDLFYVRPFSVDGSIARHLMPLNNLGIDEQFDATKSIAWKSKSGIYYALPYVGIVQGVYYNKELFERFGISVPRTWEEFMRNLERIKAQDPHIVPIANVLNMAEDSEMFMSLAANFLGGPSGRARYMRVDEGGQCYDDARVVRIFKAIEDLKPYLPEDAATMRSQESKELFFEGRAAMMFGGSFDVQTVAEEVSFDWDVFAVPAPLGWKTYVIFQPDVGIGINRNTPHPQEARMFLEWLMTREATELTARTLAGFYPLHKMETTQAVGPNDAKFLKLVNDYDSDIRWTYTEISSKVPSALEIVRRNLFEIMTSDLTPEEAAYHLQHGLAEWYEPAQSCLK